MHWVYVLKASESGSIYVGETTRLYRRWIEHESGKCKTTCDEDYDTIIGAYKVCNNYTFLEYYEDMTKYNRYAFRCQKYWGETEDKQKALALERHITERYIIENGVEKPFTIYGSFYLNDDRCENFYFSEKRDQHTKDRPLCYCGYPCEINMKKDKTKLYFTCPVPDWVEGFDHDGKCDFWEEFKPYRQILEAWQNKPTAQQLFGIEQ